MSHESVAMPKRSTPPRGLLAALCALLLAFAVAPAHADITVALTAASADVLPGTDVDVFVDIPDSASASSCALRWPRASSCWI